MAVYIIQADDGIGHIKIGVSNDPWRRIETLKTANPCPFELLALIEGDVETERKIHEAFSEHRVIGEWFLPHPSILNFARSAKERSSIPLQQPKKPLAEKMKDRNFAEVTLASQLVKRLGKGCPQPCLMKQRIAYVADLLDWEIGRVRGIWYSDVKHILSWEMRELTEAANAAWPKLHEEKCMADALSRVERLEQHMEKIESKYDAVKIAPWISGE